jgi:hypothetical protein
VAVVVVVVVVAVTPRRNVGGANADTPVVDVAKNAVVDVAKRANFIGGGTIGCKSTLPFLCVLVCD